MWLRIRAVSWLSVWVMSGGWRLCRQETEHYFSPKHLFCLPLPLLLRKDDWLRPFLYLISLKNKTISHQWRISACFCRLVFLKLSYAWASPGSSFQIFGREHGFWASPKGPTMRILLIHRPHFEDPTSRCLSQDDRSWTYKTQGGIQLKTGKTKQKLSLKAQLAMSQVHSGNRRNTNALLMHMIF